jgi:NAD(P)H-quinone oxidoreductase subunit I
VTLKHLFRPTITVQYPEERLVTSRRFRGYELVWYPGRCTGCATCAKLCPQGNIEIVTSRSEDNRFVVEKFEVDTGRCMFCGLCVEACPFDALFMGRNYERSSYRRRELVLSKEELTLSEKRQPSGYARPRVEALMPRQTLLLELAKERR